MLEKSKNNEYILLIVTFVGNFVIEFMWFFPGDAGVLVRAPAPLVPITVEPLFCALCALTSLDYSKFPVDSFHENHFMETAFTFIK